APCRAAAEPAALGTDRPSPAAAPGPRRGAFPPLRKRLQQLSAYSAHTAKADHSQGRIWFAGVSEPIVVEVRRGGAVEAVHRVHAVAVRSGEGLAAAGEPSPICF